MKYLLVIVFVCLVSTVLAKPHGEPHVESKVEEDSVVVLEIPDDNEAVVKDFEDKEVKQEPKAHQVVKRSPKPDRELYYPQNYSPQSYHPFRCPQQAFRF
jgi:hypothetical protein